MPHLPQMPSPNVHESARTVEESASTVHVVGARGQIGLFLWPAVLLLPGMAPHIFSLIGNEYLFTVTGVKKMKWFLSLTRCHFQAGNGTECEVKTIELSSPTGGGEQ